MYRIQEYSDDKEKIWDEFIYNKSINGTFLQSRRFLNYHPKNRFEDCSLIIYDLKGNVCALVPACVQYENEQKIFYSHKGSTFGGIVISAKYYKTKYVIPMIEELKKFWCERKYDKICLKIPSDLFCLQRMDLFSYAFQYCGFIERKELSTYVNLTKCKEPLISNLAQGKRTNVHNCLKRDLKVRVLNDETEIAEFYNVLCCNLRKYDVKPVHTLDELIDLKNRTLQDECEFFGCFEDGKLIAGSMMFYFLNCKTAHTQYLCAKEEYGKLSPMSFVYFQMMKLMKERGFTKLSWGIATEDGGNSINLGLISSKEEFGSRYCNNLTYYYS